MEKSGTLLDFAQIDTLSKLSQYTEQRVQREDDPVRAITFVSERSPVKIFNEFEPDGFRIEIEDQGEFVTASLTRRLKGQGEEYDEDGYRYVNGEFYLFSHTNPEVYTAYTISDNDFYQYGLKRYLQALPPELTLSFIDSSDLRRLFEALDDSIDGQLIATRAVIKSPGANTDVRYFDDTDYFEVFNSPEVNEEAYYVDKLEFEVRQSSREFSGQVSRKGESRFVDGESVIYFQLLLENIASLISDKSDLFSNRSRKYGSREAEPIQITYREGAIEGREENYRLIRALDGLSKSSVTVYHDNPYMHASVLDFNDGTSADVFLTSDSNVSIIPGFNASQQALSRITDQILEGFREGEISVGRGSKRDFDDYFSEG
ncbi:MULTISPECIES: hypothetical protein [Natrialbaceae]|uniref:hypothetical protein n=1 Tax=Natrialbaceae TaxID=1644061 RepID=UPI00207C937A|nr:hypothetical protein [Natronococcus sp. CG52]